MTRRTKWGVIGSVGIACRRTIPEGILPARNATLTAVYDITASVNREAGRKFNAPAAGSLDELLETDLDAAHAATPTHVHCEQVHKCARAGEHVLCEKPLGLQVREAGEALAACREAGVALGTAFMMRLHSQRRPAPDMILEGRLGTPAYGGAQLSCWYSPLDAWRQDPARGGGGWLIDMGSPSIDLLEMFIGPVARVSCFIYNTVHAWRSEDSIPDESSENALALCGCQGCIPAKGRLGQTSRGMTISRCRPSGTGYDARQTRAPAVPGEAGSHSQKVLAACCESARTGRAVEIG
jgi:predicted dehydrogenase